jgi:OOP family OmpA-OmpF porin
MKLKAIFAIAAVSASSMASAQWYGGVSFGAGNASLSARDVPVSVATANSIDKNENSTGYKIQLGYQLNSNFALEGGYVDLGKMSITNNVTAPIVGSLRGDVKADGWNVMAVGILPMSNDFSLIGKVGALFSTTKGDYSTTGAVTLPAGVRSSYTKDETNLAYGVGLQYNINKSISVRGEVESFVDLRPADTSSKRTVNLYSIGLIFKF